MELRLSNKISSYFVSSQDEMVKKKKLLNSVLNYFIKNRSFPKVEKFEAENIADIKIIRGMIAEGFLTQRNDYWLYTLTLEGLLFIQSVESNRIVSTINFLILELKQLYLNDVEAYYSISDLALKSDVSQMDIIISLDLMRYTGCNGGTITDEQTQLPKSVKATHSIINMTNLLSYVEEAKEAEKKRQILGKFYGRYWPAIKENFNPTLTLLVSIATLCILIYSTFFKQTGG